MATQVASGHSCGSDLARALGLDPGLVQRIILDVSAENAVVAYVKLYVTEPQMRAITDTVMMGKVAGEIGPNEVVKDGELGDPPFHFGEVAINGLAVRKFNE